MLFADRLELKGWNWVGRYRRVIYLEHVRQVVWLEGQENCNLELRLADGEIVELWMRRAGQWKAAIDAFLGAGISADGLPPVAEVPPPSAPVRIAV